MVPGLPSSSRGGARDSRIHRDKILVVAAMAIFLAGQAALPARGDDRKPNIVFILMDNLAYGELGVYGGGILRGAPTPRIDKLASEGLRLLNFNVEPSCTPTRSAIMTGRFPIRSGTYKVIEIGQKDQDLAKVGLVQWETTIAELLSSQGYATGIYGKWHLGLTEGRYPTNQGFDEWYGIPDSGNMSFWPEESYFDKNLADFEYVMEGRKGEKARVVKVFDNDARRSIDLELLQKAKSFIERNAKASKPFYAYIPLTQVHLPVWPAREFDGKTGNGDWADVLAQTDWITGQLLDEVDRLGIRDNTVFVFTSDNGAEETYPWRGWAGPWSGSYVTAMEGSLRAPFIIRWPNRIPAGRVTNEIVHAVDMFTTVAHIGGAPIPTDRPIDGVDQTDFFMGKQAKSNRDWFPAYVGTDLYAVKWRNWKIHYIWRVREDDPPQKLAMAKFFNLYTNPQERPDESLNLLMQNTWILGVVDNKIAEFTKSFEDYPPIPYGAPDPYEPPAKKGR